VPHDATSVLRLGELSVSWSKSDGLCPLLAKNHSHIKPICGYLWHILRDWRLLLPDVLPPFLLSPPALALLFRSGPQFTMCPGWMLRHSCFWRHLPSWKESVWLNLYTLSLDSPPTAEMHAVPKLLQLSTCDDGQFSLLRQELSTIGINRILLAVLLLH